MKSSYYNMHHRKRLEIDKRAITCGERFPQEDARDAVAEHYGNCDYPIFAKIDLDWDDVDKEAFLYAEEVEITDFEPADTKEWYYLCVVDEEGRPYVVQLFRTNDAVVEEVLGEYRRDYMCTLKIVDNGIGDAVVTMHQERKDLFPEEYHAKA